MPTQEYRNIDPKRDQWITDAATGEMIGIRQDQGKSLVIRTFGVPVAGSLTLAAQHVDALLDVSAAATLTIPTDQVLGISGSAYRATIVAYQVGVGAVAWAAGAGVTLVGTAPTAAQYLTTGVMRVSSNTWAYL